MSWSEVNQLSKVSYGESLYYIADKEARAKIDALGVPTHYLGETTTAISDGSTTRQITINGNSVTAESGDIVVYGNAEFIWTGSSWAELGDTSGLGLLAYKDAGYVPSETISGVKATGSMTGTISVALSYTKTAIADKQYEDYTPQGTVSVTLSNTKTSLSDFTYSSYTPEGNITISTTQSQENISDKQYASYTPAGTVSVVLSHTDTAATISASDYTPAGSVSGSVTVPTSATLSKSEQGIQVSGTISKSDVIVTSETSQFASSQFATAGSLPTFVPSVISVAQGGITVSVNGEELTISQASTASVLGGASSFNGGAFPTLSTKQAVVGATATMGNVAFTGDKYNIELGTGSATLSAQFTGSTVSNFIVSGVKYDNASVDTHTFTGTTESSLKVTGAKYTKVSASSAAFTGISASIKVSGASYQKVTVEDATFSGTTATKLRFTGANYDKASVETQQFNPASIQLDVGDIEIKRQDVIFTESQESNENYEDYITSDGKKYLTSDGKIYKSKGE